MGSSVPLASHNQGLLPIEPGTRLGPYEVQEVIGQGAMGVVYRAYHAELERVGAVKVLLGIGVDRDSKARFRREAQAIAHMRHPNILNVYDFGEYKGTPYMIVEYVPGGSLEGRLQRGPVDRQRAIDYLRGIAQALDYAHSLGIVHRDVKPANVLLGPDDTPILADFGLAKLLESSSIKSITGITTGTPAYMSPEQVMGSEVGPAADRYSLATIAYELLTGAYPFDGEGVLEMLYAHVHREPPAPSASNPDLGPAVDAVLLRALAKGPDERWPSCEAFVAALASALEAGPSPTARDTVPPLHSAPPPTARPEPTVRGAAATYAMAPPLPATRPVRAPAKIERTEVVAPPSVTEKKPRRRFQYAGGAVALIAVLLLAGYCGYGALSGPTLALSPSTARAGDQVVVTASHVPADQAGEIQLHSDSYVVPFRSDRNGDVTASLTIPSDATIGEHVVQLCWSGACHAQATLRVVGGAGPAVPSPSPSGTPTQGPSQAPGGGTTAPPTTAPKGGSTPAPSPGASPVPSPQPTPTPPPPPPPASITVTPNHFTLLNRTGTVSGVHFGAGKSVTIAIVQGGSAQATFTTTAASDGSFSKGINVPATVRAGDATVTACDSNGSCASAVITVTLT